MLIVGAVALARDPERGRRIALATLVFAILGFIVGLNCTVQGGDPIDVAYHATMLPLLVVTLIAVTGHPFSRAGVARRVRSPE
ncbi:MAG: hypothetical protein JOY58_18495 [Solirubrobacterales bacterium]|nr:hypothetical protein [Solirubrobacterales bacterium]